MSKELKPVTVLGRFRRWCFRQGIKDRQIIQDLENKEKDACIAYENWCNSLNKSGYPKNSDGTMMDCWQLYSYYRNNKKRDVYIHHAKTFDSSTK